MHPSELNLPALKSREEMLEVLQREEYGYLPPAPTELTWTSEEFGFSNAFAGKATLHKHTAHCVVNGKTFSFPFYSAMPTDGKPHPFFIHINFRPNIPDLYMPTEELLDNGFAVLSFCYEDVTTDNGDFTNGLAGVLYENGERGANDAGKIAMWAWAAQRVMDYAQTRSDVLDLSCGIVCGHSRLGKTALLTAATDERFAFVYSNESGCSGAAITREKRGERVREICHNFWYWFCPDYQKYIDKEDEMPFDQHWLLAASAPRYVLVGSATEDIWADPEAELCACIAASDAFQNGLVYTQYPAERGDVFLEGDIGFHLRGGRHFFSREDWQKLIRFVNLHRA